MYFCLDNVFIFVDPLAQGMIFDSSEVADLYLSNKTRTRDLYLASSGVYHD